MDDHRHGHGRTCIGFKNIDLSERLYTWHQSLGMLMLNSCPLEKDHERVQEMLHRVAHALIEASNFALERR